MKRVRQPGGIENILDLLLQTSSAKASAVVSSQDEVVPARDFSSLAVLVAEDNEVNTQVIRAMLKEYGIEADFAVNGEQAVRYVVQEGKQYDIIMMDCEMLVLDGYLAVEKIRAFEQSHGQSRSMICALTAHALQEVEDKCRAVGMDEVLTKPLKIEKLEAFLERVKPS